MRIAITDDDSLEVSPSSICDIINSRSVAIEATTSSYRFAPEGSQLSGLGEVARVSVDDRATPSDALAFYLTMLPFRDNYFYHGEGNRAILSFSGWDLLTDLPLANGIVYMICRYILKHELDVGVNHNTSTGCLNDYMWDKRVVDVAIRAAYHCSQCRDATPEDTLASLPYKDLMNVLDFVAVCSRQGRNVIEAANEIAATDPDRKRYDAFLSYNSQDKVEVRRLNQALSSAGIKTWFDEQRLMPGEVWQDVLDDEIGLVRACLVIVGSDGEGRWQKIERRSFIEEFADRGCRVIPVIVGSGKDKPELSRFLRHFMWSDLRDDDGTELKRLIAALRSS